MEFQNAFKMVKDLVPDFHVHQVLDPDDQYTQVAIFCAADFDDETPPHKLNHWIPALRKDQTEKPDELHKQWTAESQKLGRMEIEDLEKRRPVCLNKIELMSLEQEIALKKLKFKNFQKMQKSLYESFGLLCRDVVPDGNCGCYVLMCLIRDVHPDDLNSDDVVRFREDLGSMWRDAAKSEKWQKVWEQFRRDGAPFRDTESDPQAQKTPEPKKQPRPEDLPFTPDKVNTRKRLTPASA